MHPNVESRFKKRLIRCPVCNKPIGERKGNQWWFLKYGEGKIGKIPFTMNQKTPSGSYTVNCWDKNCKGGHVFAWINEEIKINDLTIKKLK